MTPLEKMRLNRYIARCGAASRRDAEKFILSGRVRINGTTCTELATTVQPGVDSVTLNDSPLTLPSLQYFKYYKPRGVTTTMDDPHADITVADVLLSAGIINGVIPAGRLDLNSEGLLILTNDGDLTYRLTHPGFSVEKIYRALIDRWPVQHDLNQLLKGVQCDDFTATASKISRMGPQPKDDDNPVPGYWIEIVMTEGKKREIREMLNAIGYSVLRLVRIAHGPVCVSNLRPGQVLQLSEPETERLLSLI